MSGAFMKDEDIQVETFAVSAWILPISSVQFREVSAEVNPHLNDELVSRLAFRQRPASSEATPWIIGVI